MSAKAIVFGAAVLALVGGRAIQGAEPPMLLKPLSPAAYQTGAPAVTAPPAEVLPLPASPAMPGAAAPSSGISYGQGTPPGTVADPWIAYSRPGCCGPLGANGPIGGEWFYRNGASIPVAGGILREALQTGWITEFGGRALFFNKETSAAWTSSVGVSFTFNNSGLSDLIFDTPLGTTAVEQVPDPLNPGQTVPRNVFRIVDHPVTIRDYQRWSLNVALGREWYLFNPAYQPGRHFRVGLDSGGRWGYGRVDLNDLSGILDPNNPAGLDSTIFYRHSSDVFGGVFVAAHADLEIPICCGASTFITGFRAEWSYNWTDVLPTQLHDLQDVNLFWTIGFRY